VKIRRLLVTILVVAGVVLGVSSCDNRPCLRGHYDYEPMPISTGKTTTVTIVPVWFCDVYGKPGAGD
jgi:hypothetical protein